jgi:hypothetical protein
MNPDQKLALLTQAIKDAGTSSPTELREKLAEIPMLASAKEIQPSEQIISTCAIGIRRHLTSFEAIHCGLVDGDMVDLYIKPMEPAIGQDMRSEKRLLK